MSNDVEGILRSLSSRPNVHSTLILSRKNGSVIRASGAITKDFSTPSRASLDTDGDKLNEEENEQADGSPTKPQMSEVEILAQAVLAFVSAATGLSSVMSSISANPVSRSGAREDNTTAEASIEEGIDEETDATNDNDMQLLRMRTKRQEIIIFPDPNFLCCVVQNILRGSASHDSR